MKCDRKKMVAFGIRITCKSSLSYLTPVVKAFDQTKQPKLPAPAQASGWRQQPWT